MFCTVTDGADLVCPPLLELDAGTSNSGLLRINKEDSHFIPMQGLSQLNPLAVFALRTLFGVLDGFCSVLNEKTQFNNSLI